MNMKLLTPWPLVAVALSALTPARLVAADGVPAANQTPAQRLLGTWHIDGYADQKARRGRWFLEWTFADGKFKEDGYPPLEQSGSYRVLSSQGNKLTLELYAQKGTFGSKNGRLDIAVDPKQDQLKIGTNGPFKRVKPKPKPAAPVR